MNQWGLQGHDLTLTFERGLDAVLRSISDGGMIVFAKIDHAAGARDVGMTLQPSTVILYGHPRGGTPIMSATPDAALDLPLRVLLREREDGNTVLVFRPIADVLRAAGVPEELTSRLDAAQQRLVDAVRP